MRARRRWTESHVTKLRGMALKVPTAQIASELGRAVSATRVNANELRISLRMKPKRGSRGAFDTDHARVLSD
jgi:hypothetical protein